MAARVRLGMIIPSSNTVVEQETARLITALPHASLHFARFKLTAVSVADPAAAYYRSGLLLEAGKLLADARCHAICWNGSAGGLVGLEHDRALCRDLEVHTAIPATTSSLALVDAFRATGVRRFAMATLNPPVMNAAIVRNFAVEGFECVASTQRSDLEDNFAMAEIDADAIAGMVEQCARARPQAITVFGTNTRGAPIAAGLERRLGIPVYDSVALGLWSALRCAGVDCRPLSVHGRLFDLAS